MFLLLVFFSGTAMAQCSEELDKEFALTIENSPYDVDRLEKIYKSCQEAPVEMLLHTAKGDRYEANGKMEYAYTEYEKALYAYGNINVSESKPYRGLAKHLKKLKKQYAPKTAKEITRGTIEETIYRGGKMVTEFRIEDLPLNFQSNSSVVDVVGVNHEQVEAIYEALLDKKYNGKVIKIIGFTDTSASASYNQGLSTQRAKALETYLKNKGLKNYISSQGVGESQPICTEGEIVRKKNYEYECSKKENKYRSRRVTISIRDE